MASISSRLFGLALVASLHLVAIDMMTVGWFVMGFFVFVSAVRVLLRRREHVRVVFVAAALSTVLFPASCVSQVAAWGAARERVFALGDVAQERCRRDGVCPTIEELCGGGDCGTAGTTVRHAIRYATSDDRRHFAAWVRLTIDDQVSADGGVDQPLEHVTITKGRSTRIEGR